MPADNETHHLYEQLTYGEVSKAEEKFSTYLAWYYYLTVYAPEMAGLFLLLSTVGTAGVLITLIRTKDFRSYFYGMLAVNVIFEWLVCFTNLGRTIQNSMRVCPKYEPVGGVYALTHCKSLLGVIYIAYWQAIGWASDEVVGWCAIFIGCDRVFALMKPLKYRKFHETYRKLILIFSFGVIFLIFTTSALPRYDFWIIRYTQVENSTETMLIAMPNTARKDIDLHRIFEHERQRYYYPLQLGVQLIVQLTSAFLIMWKAKFKIRELEKTNKKNARAQRSLLKMGVVALCTSCPYTVMNCVSKVVEVLRYDAQTLVFNNPSSATLEQLNSYWHTSCVAVVVGLLFEPLYFTFTLQFYLMIAFVGSFRRAAKKCLIDPITCHKSTVVPTSSVTGLTKG